MRGKDAFSGGPPQHAHKHNKYHLLMLTPPSLQLCWLLIIPKEHKPTLLMPPQQLSRRFHPHRKHLCELSTLFFFNYYHYYYYKTASGKLYRLPCGNKLVAFLKSLQCRENIAWQLLFRRTFNKKTCKHQCGWCQTHFCCVRFWAVGSFVTHSINMSNENNNLSREESNKHKGQQRRKQVFTWLCVINGDYYFCCYSVRSRNITAATSDPDRSGGGGSALKWDESIKYEAIKQEDSFVITGLISFIM